MPAWKDRLSEKEIWEVVAYILTLSKLTSDSADSPQVSATPQLRSDRKAPVTAGSPPKQWMH